MILFVNIQKQLGANADLMDINGSNRIDILPAFYFGMDQTLASDHIHDRLQIIFEPTDDPQHCYLSMVRIRNSISVLRLFAKSTATRKISSHACYVLEYVIDI